MKRTLLAVAAAGLLASLSSLASLAGLAACSRAGDAVVPPVQGATAALALTAPSASTAAPAPAASCGHAACADNFFVDAVPGDCTAGSPCTLTLNLVATGDFHINDEYPYRFKADDSPGLQFLGTDATGPNQFTKGAGNWQKSAEKTGSMVVKFTPAATGPLAISGTLKLSVCSAQNCLLDQRQVSATVLAR